MTTIEISLSPEQYFNSALLHEEVSRHANIPSCDISHIEIKRRSLDSRRGIRYITRIDIYTHNDTYSATDYSSPYTDCHNAPPVVIVGAGPAGLFAALHALECGIKPIIVERGKAVETRKKDISMMVRNRLVNSGSNWCYGEGGAGTFSDGKLYTRSTKRGNVNDILRKFVEHGANSDIMIDAHAHIGTDRLGGIIAKMRKTILDYGGEYHFDSKVEDFIIHEGRVCGVKCSGGDTFEGIATILATGHSARDIYSLFLQ